MKTAICCFRRPTDSAPSRRARPCWRSAAQAGRGSAPTGRGQATLAAKRVAISPLRPANCGFLVGWSEIFRDRFEGEPFKGIALTFGPHTVRGEAVITRAGIEGGAIYALSAELREAIAKSGEAMLHVALRPDLETGDLIRQLSTSRGKQSFSNFLRKAVRLSPIAIGLLQEAAMASAVALSSLPTVSLAALINAVPIELTGVAPIARAISTAGGISFDELDADFMIRCLPASSPPAKCSTGKRRPAAICCRRRSRRERRRGRAR